METLFTAFVSDIANRFVSFLIDKYFKKPGPAMEDPRLLNLQHLLCRVCAVVEEAEGRNITNRAMVHQLNMWRKEMYRGYFTMDKFRIQAGEEDKSKDLDVSHPFALSKFSPYKRFFSSTGVAHGEKELQQVIDNLNTITAHMSEFITFLNNYTPLYRQPYGMHLILDKCMFGRQMEMERIINFLMLVEPQSTKNVGVLPIVGPCLTGKSTIVAHVCNDERVRNNFTQIVFITENDLEDKSVTALNDGGAIVHKNNSLNGNERVLIVIELSENVDEAALKSYLASVTCLASVVKIIITSRSGKIVNSGTTQALLLNFLPIEAFWYFFKVLTFGSADPTDHPKLESIAMEISRDISGSFLGANIISSFLRDNIHYKHWCTLQANLRALIKNNVCLSAHDRPKSRPTYLRSMDNTVAFSVYGYRENSADDTVPNMRFSDVLFRSVKSGTRFEVLAWQSRIPPYKNYMYSCEVQSI
ncbi:hypothetical protein ACP70R_015185 [Stipagrostis hirtigluma subsp. patula]